MATEDKKKAQPLVLENTSRRDELIAYEKKFQEIWQNEKVFEVDAPETSATDIVSGEELRKKYPKFFGTMAYPYMNGTLHAGHSFTLSKVEFATGYERMLGKRALFPLGFHCTGLPIKACADKLVREIEMFGKNFDQNVPSAAEEEAAEEEAAAAKAATAAAGKTDPTKFKAKKSKAVAKQGRAKYQFEIMLQIGIPREDVHKFADASHWLAYFPPLCKRDCNNFGARIDWRRSFVTTDANPYYDSFIQWQMNMLKGLSKIKFGERYTVYSAKDGQPCMDHDRQTGEGLGPQEYVGVKMPLLEWPAAALAEVKESFPDFDEKSTKTFLVAATLRAETLYGITSCFVSPKIKYGLFKVSENEYFITTERAFKNMCFQNLTPKRGDWSSSATVSGATLIGADVQTPSIALNRRVKLLPMETILASKGTGVVISVPSDSPDDYITMQDLANKPEYYKIQKEWATDYPIIPIIKTPTYGDVTAEALVKELKIQSPKDKDLLAKAKELAYKEGFYQGIMLVGKYKGERVEVAKPLVRDDLIALKEAFLYSEPEGLITSRSGDECVISLEDQWYTDYGEDTWKAQAIECLNDMETYTPETKHAFAKCLEWLKNWALSRTYGLGTKIPWDPKYLVESLSDSTIYMAYYTIAHFLHGDIFGKTPGKFNIPVEKMTEQVWDFIFCRREDIVSDIPKEQLTAMRKEFDYFYPLDVRISAKDLITNHLTFFIYIHTAMFPKKFWPRGIRINGHLLLNGEKMSKSTGNFMTLEELTKKFGADATRIALADAGDTLEDANFDEANANAAILRLHTLKGWSEEMMSASFAAELRESGSPYNYVDKFFENEMNELIIATNKEYKLTNYKLALKSGLFDFQIARDYYREAVGSVGMHKDLVVRYIETQALLLLPIAPHFAEYIWKDVLHKKDTVHNANFPQPTQAVDVSMSAALRYVRSTSRAIREAEGAAVKKSKGKKGGVAYDPKKPSSLTIYIAKSYPDWQGPYVDLVAKHLSGLSLEMTPEVKKEVGALGDVKRGMQFVNFIKTRIASGEPADEVLSRKLIFNEIEVAVEALEIFQKSATNTVIEKITLVVMENGEGVNALTKEPVPVPVTKAVQDAIPGKPAVAIENL